MLANIRLQHFRSYEDDTFEFEPGVNIVVGPNASGKTNLLEALLVLCVGVSYRVHFVDLVGHDAAWARLDGGTTTGNRTVRITRRPAAKTYEIDGRAYRRLPPSRALPAVLFEPNHLVMFGGAPESRRSYMDDLLEQLNSSFGRLRRDYRRVLAQRNALLKRSGLSARAQLFPWDVRLSELGGKIVRERLGLLELINRDASRLYSDLAGHPSRLVLTYRSGLPPDSYESALLRRLETGLELDAARGYTGAGPHREDMELHIDSRPSVSTASRGEVRSAVLTLKILELELVESARQAKPVLLLDDVFSELDGRRRQALTTRLRQYQTFITTTDADVVVQHFTDTAHILPLTSK